MPRPRLVTGSMIRAAVAMINAGNPVEGVARRLGVHRSTLMLYLRVVRREKRLGKKGTFIAHVEISPTAQCTAGGMATPAPYVRGYRW